MSLFKIATLLNWIFIAILFIAVAIGILFPAKGGDAATKGIGQGLVVIGTIVLIVLIVLNILPYKWTRYAALGLIAMPFVTYMAYTVRCNVKQTIAQRAEDAKPIFPDIARDQAARAIYAANPDQLRKVLHQPMPLLNEGSDLLQTFVTLANNEFTENTYSTQADFEQMKAIIQ